VFVDDFDTYTKFVESRRLASGSLLDLLQTTKEHIDRNMTEEKAGESLLIFHD
jgi:hypothetical protein